MVRVEASRYTMRGMVVVSAGSRDTGVQLELLRALVNGLPAMLAYWDASLTCRFANRAYEVWFGVDPDKMVGRNMAEFLGPLYALNRPYIEGALRGEPQCFEREIPDPRGGPARHSEALYMPDLAPGDGAVRGFCVLVTDITSRKLREVELRAAKREARAERDVLEHFFTLSVDLMCIVGPDGRFRRISPAFEALGYARDELVGQPWLALVHPDDLAATEATLAGSAGGAPLRIEIRCGCRDGSYRWLAWSGATDDAGVRYLIARDVTAARRAHDELVRARDAAEAANRELEAFSYSVAHDLRGPLRAIDGFSQALLEDCGGVLAPSHQHSLGRVRKAAQHMAQLIDDLLALSRVTRAPLACDRVDLTALARASIARLRRGAPERDVDVAIEAGLHVEGDARLLGVALDNLVDNAWKFTRGCPEARIELGATTQGGQRVFFVRDNGVGFDMAFASKLFGVFQRLHSAVEYDGTGVGLATAHRIITRHDGRIWADAAPGRGATFWFTLFEHARSASA